MARRENREALSCLNDLKDYEVADGEPDPRGWDVFASDGVRVGRIEDLLIDTGEMRVRAIDLIIDQRALNLPEGDNHLYVPIRSVSLDEGAQRAVVPGLRSEQVGTLRGRRDFDALETSMGQSRGRETATREPGAREDTLEGTTTGRTGGTTTGRTGGTTTGRTGGTTTGRTGDITTGRTTREDTSGFQAGTREPEPSQMSREDIRLSRARSEAESRRDTGTRDESERGRRR